MRHKALCLLLVPLLLATACSRLTFVRPKMERKDGEQIAQDYSVKDSSEVKRRQSVQMMVSRSVQRLQAGDLETAEKEARAALKLAPDSADAETLLAVVADRRGQSEQAGQHYRRAAELAPAQGAMQNNYGTWLCANGRGAESLGWFDKALADPQYPTPAAAAANAGTCANGVGQQDRAEASWRQALALEPTNLPSLAGMAALQFARGQYLDARAFAERWLALVPGDADGLQLAARIEQKLGDNVAAQRYLFRLQATSPGSTTAPRAQ